MRKEFLYTFMFIGIMLLVGVIISITLHKMVALPNKLLRGLFIIGGVLLVISFFSFSILMVDSWFYNPGTVIILYTPFFLGVETIIIGIFLLIIRKIHGKVVNNH